MAGPIKIIKQSRVRSGDSRLEFLEPASERFTWFGRRLGSAAERRRRDQRARGIGGEREREREERGKREAKAANGWTDGHEADSIGLISPSEPNYPPNGQIYC